MRTVKSGYDLKSSCDFATGFELRAGTDEAFAGILRENFDTDTVGLPFTKKVFSATVLTGATILGGFVGTTSPAVRQDTFVTVGETRPGAIDTTPKPRFVVVTSTEQAPQTERSDREEVNWVKEHSGLTWDQLGKAFGVTRRAVHMWSNGARLNEANATRLREFSAVIERLERDGARTPEAVRSRLLEIDTGGNSILGRLREAHTSGPTWGMPHGPEHFIDAIQTPFRNPVGENPR